MANDSDPDYDPSEDDSDNANDVFSEEYGSDRSSDDASHIKKNRLVYKHRSLKSSISSPSNENTQKTRPSSGQVNLYQCSLCFYQSPYRYQLKWHMKSCKGPNSRNIWECPACKSLSPFGKLIKVKDEGKNKYIYQCPRCSFKAKKSSQIDILEKIRHNANRPYCCSRCKAKIYGLHSFKNHLKSSHSLTLLYKCEYCQYSTLTTEKLEEHKKSHSALQEMGLIQCSHCNLDFFTVREAQEHMQRVKMGLERKEIVEEIENLSSSVDDGESNQAKNRHQVLDWTLSDDEDRTDNVALDKAKNKKGISVEIVPDSDNEVEKNNDDMLEMKRKDIVTNKYNHPEANSDWRTVYKCNHCDVATPYRGNIVRHLKNVHRASGTPRGFTVAKVPLERSTLKNQIKNPALRGSNTTSIVTPSKSKNRAQEDTSTMKPEKSKNQIKETAASGTENISISKRLNPKKHISSDGHDSKNVRFIYVKETNKLGQYHGKHSICLKCKDCGLKHEGLYSLAWHRFMEHQDKSELVKWRLKCKLCSYVHFSKLKCHKHGLIHRHSFASFHKFYGKKLMGALYFRYLHVGYNFPSLSKSRQYQLDKTQKTSIEVKKEVDSDDTTETPKPGNTFSHLNASSTKPKTVITSTSDTPSDQIPSIKVADWARSTDKENNANESPADVQQPEIMFVNVEDIKKEADSDDMYVWKKSEEYFTCSKCTYETKFKSNLPAHKLLVHDDLVRDENNKFQCPQGCGFETKYRHSIKRHLERVHKSDLKEYYLSSSDSNKEKQIEEKEEESFASPDGKHRCPHCKFESIFKRSVKHHLRRYHRKESSTPESNGRMEDYILDLDEDVDNGSHNKKEEEDYSPISEYPISDRKMKDYIMDLDDKIANGSDSKKENKPYVLICKYCRRKYDDRYNLDVHLFRYHSNKNVLYKWRTQCTLCSFQTHWKRQAKKHVESKHRSTGPVTFEMYYRDRYEDRFIIDLKNLKYACKMCNFVTNTFYNLKKHGRKHRKQNIDYSFIPSGTHEESEEGSYEFKCEKRELYKCTECDFVTSRPRYLYYHNKKHEKPNFKPRFSSFNDVFEQERKRLLLDAERKKEQRKAKKGTTEEMDSSDEMEKNEKVVPRTKQGDKASEGRKIGPLNCRKCSAIYYSQYPLSFHMFLDHQDKAEIEKWRFDCTLCDFRTHTKKGAAAHARRKHSDPKQPRMVEFETFYKNQFEFTHKYQCDKKKERKLNECSECEFACWKVEYYKRHLEKYHNPDSKLTDEKQDKKSGKDRRMLNKIVDSEGKKNRLDPQNDGNITQKEDPDSLDEMEEENEDDNISTLHNNESEEWLEELGGEITLENQDASEKVDTNEVIMIEITPDNGETSIETTDKDLLRLRSILSSDNEDIDMEDNDYDVKLDPYKGQVVIQDSEENPSLSLNHSETITLTSQEDQSKSDTSTKNDNKPNRTFKCNLCQKMITNWRLLQEHTNIHSETLNKPELVVTFSEFSRNKFFCKLEIKAKTKSCAETKQASEITFKCWICGAFILKQESLQNHTNIHARANKNSTLKVRYSKFCDDVVESTIVMEADPNCLNKSKRREKDDDDDDEDEFNPDLPVFSCGECNFKTNKEGALNKHKNLHWSSEKEALFKAQKYFTCDVCFFHCFDDHTLKEHKEWHKKYPNSKKKF